VATKACGSAVALVEFVSGGGDGCRRRAMGAVVLDSDSAVVAVERRKATLKVPTNLVRPCERIAVQIVLSSADRASPASPRSYL